MAAQQTESDKALTLFEAQNTSVESYILLTSEGVPFKYNPNNISHQDAVKYAGLIYDLILFSKRTLDDLKKTPHHGNMTLRLRLKTGSEIVVVQEQDFYLITVQVCKISVDNTQTEKEGEKKA